MIDEVSVGAATSTGGLQRHNHHTAEARKNPVAKFFEDSHLMNVTDSEMPQ